MNNLVNYSKAFVTRNASTILTCIGAAGVVATTVAAVKATPKAVELLDQAKFQKGEKLSVLETIQTAGMMYVPSVLIGMSTIACIFGANILNKRHQAALVSAYTVLDSSFKEYKNKVREIYGDEAEAQIRKSIMDEAHSEGDEKELFYDTYSNRYFEATMADVLTAEYNTNKFLALLNAVSIGEFYDFLGLEYDSKYDDLGWASGANHQIYWNPWIEFLHTKTTLDDGLECTIINIPIDPFEGYMNY